MNIMKKHVTKEWILYIAAGRIVLKHVISGVYDTKMQSKLLVDKIIKLLANYILHISYKRILVHPCIKQVCTGNHKIL